MKIHRVKKVVHLNMGWLFVCSVNAYYGSGAKDKARLGLLRRLPECHPSPLTTTQ